MSFLRSRGVAWLGAIIIVAFGVRLGVASQALPLLQVHPLPTSLAQWQASGDDYFAQIEKTPVGYLIWSELPIRVYLKYGEDGSSAALQGWVEALQQAVQEWNAYLPLVVVDQPDADIVIERTHPERKVRIRDGQLDIPRARAAETRYRFYLKDSILRHRMTIQIRPGYGESTVATARHELGHALGIWGHSPLETDALYFSQVRYAPPISARDVKTLKKIYGQPTRLGFKLTRSPTR